MYDPIVSSSRATPGLFDSRFTALFTSASSSRVSLSAIYTAESLTPSACTFDPCEMLEDIEDLTSDITIINSDITTIRSDLTEVASDITTLYGSDVSSLLTQPSGSTPFSVLRPRSANTATWEWSSEVSMSALTVTGQSIVSGGALLLKPVAAPAPIAHLIQLYVDEDTNAVKAMLGNGSAVTLAEGPPTPDPVDLYGAAGHTAGQAIDAYASRENADGESWATLLAGDGTDADQYTDDAE